MAYNNSTSGKWGLPANETTPPLWQIYQTEHLAVLIVQMIIAFPGGVMNTFLLAVFMMTASLRTATGLLIGQILFAEAAGCLVLMPMGEIWTYVSRGRYRSTLGCAFHRSIFNTLQNVIHWLSLFLAINRFVAIIYPYKYSAWKSKKAIGIGIALCWLFSLISSAPFMGIGATNIVQTNLWNKCNVRISPQYLLFWTIWTINIALGSQVIVYILIQLYLFKKSRVRQRVDPVAPRNQLLEQRESRFRLFRTLLASTWLFVLCYLPMLVMIMMNYRGVPRNIMLDLLAISFYMTASALNPIVLIIVNSDFRRASWDLLQRMSSRRRIHPGGIQCGEGAGILDQPRTRTTKEEVLHESSEQPAGTATANQVSATGSTQR